MRESILYGESPENKEGGCFSFKIFEDRISMKRE